jgi:maltose/maltodextrin transport system substrate-binding protein
LMTELESNANIAHTFALAATGETMPDIPEMKRFWSSMQANLQPMVTGEVKVEETMADVAKRLRKLDTMKMWTRKHYLTAAATGPN